MTNCKSTKKALLTSVIALVLCFSMLIGTTFAWFTDEVKSGVNQIMAGNLDVDVVTTDGNSIENVTTLFNDVNGEPILWEPGVVAYENITVVNKGTLALKYTMGINFSNENTVEGYGLSQILQIAVVDHHITETDRDAVIEKIEDTEWQSLSAWYKSGKLLKEGKQDYAIVIWWEPTADDNNWNVSNGKTTSDGAEALHIDLGISLTAWQLDHESDSFDSTYDANLVVNTVAEANARIALGEDVILAGAITLTKGLTANGVTFVGVTEDAAINFDGHNITGDGSSTVTYQNLTLSTISLPYGGEGVGERYGWYGGIDYVRHAEANYVNCTISGVFTTYSATVNVDGCTFLPYVQDGEEFYHIFVYDGTVNVTDSTFYYGDRSIKIYSDGAKDIEVNVSNCTFKADQMTKVNKALINVDASILNSVKLTVKNITVDEALSDVAVASGVDSSKVTYSYEG